MVLQIENAVKRFGGLTAVDCVSLRVEEKEIFGLIGPNGAGKTTLLNVVAGVYKPNAGTIKFQGEDITGLRSERICRKGIARTFQICQPFPKMTALESVMVGAIFGNSSPLQKPKVRAEKFLDYVEFPMPSDTLAASLNTVQLKRLDLARALASHPKLILLDELGAGLTPSELDDLINLIRRIRDSGITIVIVEHLMKVIMAICDRMAVLNHGEKIAQGAPNEIAEDPSVIDAYLGSSQPLGESNQNEIT
jgi:branched-chain amino acid transport system ATP-binding protein